MKYLKEYGGGITIDSSKVKVRETEKLPTLPTMDYVGSVGGVLLYY